MQIGDPIDPEEYLSGKIFLNETATAPSNLHPMTLNFSGRMIQSSAAVMKKKFKSHESATNATSAPTPVVLIPRYSPDTPGALVLFKAPPNK